MARRVRLGRIWAVPIHGTDTLPLLLVFVAAGATWQLSSAAPGYGFAAYLAAGVFSSCLFLWTVFAHETAHVAAARRYQARVKGVTLSALGGLTEIGGQPGSPWQGVVVAAAGPAVSAACGLVCIGVAFAVAAVGLPLLVAVSFAWVGLMAVLLAILNLVPAAPLDGGHVLQAVLWAGLGNRRRATAISARAGQVLAISLAVFAVWLLLHGSSPLPALVTAFVIWPVWQGASAVRRSSEQRALLGGRTVAEVMRQAPPVVSGAVSLAEAVSRLGAGHVVLVGGSGRPSAIVAAARLQRAAARGGTRPVATLRRRRAALRTATPDEGLADVLERNGARPVPVAVMDGETLVGIVEPDDVRAALAAAGTGPAPGTTADEWPGVRR